MDIAVVVTLALFMVGVVFTAGRLTARVESLEAWRVEVRADLRQIQTDIRQVIALIKGAET